MNLKEIRELVNSKDPFKFEEVIKTGVLDKRGSWLWLNIPSEEEYDDMFKVLEKYFKVEDTNPYTMYRKDVKREVIRYTETRRRPETLAGENYDKKS